MYSGGLGYEAFVSSGGLQEVLAGGKAEYTYVYAGGYQYNYGSAYGDYVYGVAYTETGEDRFGQLHRERRHTQYVYGAAYSDTIERYGYQSVDSGSLAYATTDYGNQSVESGGTADYTYVESGADQYVYSGGLAFEPYVYSGGFQEVLSGGKTDYANIYAGGYQYNYGSACWGLRLRRRIHGDGWGRFGQLHRERRHAIRLRRGRLRHR